jgi:hypothetical protein
MTARPDDTPTDPERLYAALVALTLTVAATTIVLAALVAW